MSGHTPGPWLQSHRPNGTGMYNTQVYTSDGQTICTLHWYPRPKDANGAIGTYREDNARLIAASPEMLEACEAHTAWAWAEKNHSSSTFNERLELCNYSNWLTQKALAKVQGKTPEDAYSGVPHMIMWPDPHIARADQEAAQAIVNRLIGEWRASLTNEAEGQ
jgi:hypothetical protein